MSGVAGLLHRGNFELLPLGETAGALPTGFKKILVLGETILVFTFGNVNYYRSTDGGVTFDTPSALTYAFQGGAVANGLFIVALSDGTNHRILSGSTGNSWTTVTPNEPVVATRCRTFVWNGAQYVCYTATNDANVRRIFATSTNLTTWSLSTSGTNNSSYWDVIPYAGGFMGRANGTFVPLGTNGTTEGTPYTPPGGLNTAFFQAQDSRMFTRAGVLFAGALTHVCYTSDGVTWTAYAHDLGSVIDGSVGFFALGNRDVVMSGGTTSGQIQARTALAGTGTFVNGSVNARPSGLFTASAVGGGVVHVTTTVFSQGKWNRLLYP